MSITEVQTRLANYLLPCVMLGCKFNVEDLLVVVLQIFDAGK